MMNNDIYKIQKRFKFGIWALIAITFEGFIFFLFEFQHFKNLDRTLMATKSILISLGCFAFFLILILKLLKYTFLEVSFYPQGVWIKGFRKKFIVNMINVKKLSITTGGCTFTLRDGGSFIIPNEMERYDELKDRLQRTFLVKRNI